MKGSQLKSPKMEKFAISRLTIFSVIIMLFISIDVGAQTIVKVADKEDFNKNFMPYCTEPVYRTFHMRGEVSLMKVNGVYVDSLNNKPVWRAKYPLIVKWYPIDAKSSTQEVYQQEIEVVFEVMVPRVYCKSQLEYVKMYYTHWKNGDIQSGWWDSHFAGITP